MSKYSLAFKKNDIYVEFITTNREFVNKEMEKWVNDISSLKTETVNPTQREEIIEVPKKKVAKTENTKPSIEESSTKKEDFTKILEKNYDKAQEKMSNSEVPQEQDDFADLINKKNPKLPIDFLIIASYYLGEIKNIERYSVKQLNQLIIKHKLKPINHGVIHEAVSDKLIEVVPDFTGMADVTEYKLTTKGEEYFKNGF